MPLEDYIDNFDSFEELNSTEKIKLLIYFYLLTEKKETFKTSEIISIFNKLHLKTPKNIPQIISNNCKGSKPLFIKKENGGYSFHRESKKRLDDEFSVQPKKINLKNDLFPIDLLKNTRGYIEKVGSQAIFCYDYGQFDASLVMIRKLLETLIIELFEKNKISNEIKDSEGNYFMLSQLIDKFLNNNNWTVGRTTKQFLPKIKKMADTSAHNRRFIAQKTDIDKFKDELRIIIEDILLLIHFN